MSKAKQIVAAPRESAIPFDVVIVGAGPAGATAAAILAGKGRRVALLDAAKYPRNVVCAGWISSKAKALLERLEFSAGDVVGEPFSKVTFYNNDLTKSAVPKFSDAPGFLVDRARFDQALVNAAVQAGARFMDRTRVLDIALRESSVSATVENGHPVQGGLLLLASGRESPLLERLRLPSSAAFDGWWVAHVEAAKVPGITEPWIAIVLGLDKSGGVGVVVAANGRVTVDVQTPGDKSMVVSTVTLLCKNLAKRGVLPVDMSEKASRCVPMVTPASVALAMETHVAKRTLVIGDAGGFVSALSGEGIFPAMWSAEIAAKVIDRAIGDSSPQDVLMDFNTRWRTEMADYIRPPNTDTQYILPLVFTNQPMADRMGAAFFFGENI